MKVQAGAEEKLERANKFVFLSEALINVPPNVTSYIQGTLPSPFGGEVPPSY